MDRNERRSEACRILLLEDDIATGRLLEIQIERHSIDVVRTLNDFRERWSASRYDIALIDLIVPDSPTPRETYEKARSVVGVWPMLVVSGYSDLEDLGILPGAWLAKGDLKELQEKLDRLGEHLEDLRHGHGEQVVASVRIAALERSYRDLKTLVVEKLDEQTTELRFLRRAIDLGPTDRITPPGFTTRIGDIVTKHLDTACAVVVKDKVLIGGLLIAALIVGSFLGVPMADWLKTVGAPIP